MRHPTIAASFLLLSTLCLGAQAQSALTRDQVRSELARAVRDGNVPALGDSGLTLREMYPGRYGAASAPASTTTRAQVKAELADAVRNGDVYAAGELGLKRNELHPEAYPATVVTASDKTRAQVKLEYAQAVRNGDIIDGETGKTLNELYPSRYANLRQAPIYAQGAAGAASSVTR